MTTNKRPATDSVERSDDQEELVTRFLIDTPEYFARHPELLATLAVPHPETGRAVSLVERQVKILRDRNETLTGELRNLIEIARENDQLGDRIQRFAVAMIECGTVDDVLDTAQDILRQEFSLDAVSIRLTGNPRPECPRPEFTTDDDPVLIELQQMLLANGGSARCGDGLPETLARPMFLSASTDIRSSAVIGIGRRGLNGVLVLGSRDPKRFHSDMGTLFLARIGELFMSALVRHLSTAQT